MQIRRREFLTTVGAGLWLSAMKHDPASGAAASEKPNIVLCMADDQGWGDMAYNGHPVIKTPNFDAMAAETLRFDHFYSAAPVCSPTRGSVMTGRHPNRFGCLRWGHSLRPQETTIAEALKAAGYVTGHFGKWHLGSVLEGSPVNPGANGFDEWLSAPNFFDNDPILSREGTAVQLKGESSIVTVDAAIEFIQKHADSPQPFLAVVWFGSPHNPHVAVDEDRAHYANEDEKSQNFYGEITGMDRAFGKLRKALRAPDIHDNTILWYCSDNGGLREESSGGRKKKGSIYEGGLRVPAMLEWPARIPKPRVTKVPCNTSDIFPTLVKIVGAKIDRKVPLDGINLVPLIDGKMDARPKAMGFWDHPTPGISTPSATWMAELLEAQKNGNRVSDPERLRMDAGKNIKQHPEDSFPGHAAWLDWPWKLHRIQDKTGGIKFELYNLANDSQEETDVADEKSRRQKRMKKSLEKWLTSVARSLNGKDYR